VKANRLILRKERRKEKKERFFTNYEQCLFRLHILCISTMANYIQLNKQLLRIIAIKTFFQDGSAGRVLIKLADMLFPSSKM
jgi:hypothetical protein